MNAHGSARHTFRTGTQNPAGEALKVPDRPCPICDGNAVKLLRKQGFVLPEAHPLARGYDVVLCARCGFVYADSSVRQEDYDFYYAGFSKYEDRATSTGGGEDAQDALRLAVTANFVADHLADRAARVLDIGCANGGLLRALHQLGFTRLCGLDPSAACVANAKAVPGVDARVGSLLSDKLFTPEGLGEFDGVILSHVLEHLLDLSAAVQQLRAATRIGGMLYIEVPDPTRYADHVVAPFQDFNTEHINHFSRRSLLNLFGPSGFAEVAVEKRALPLPGGALYPALVVMYQRTDAPNSVVSENNGDEELAEAMARYLGASQRLLESLTRKLAEVVARGEPMIVWGTGQLAMKLLAETPLGQAEIAAFVDSNPIHHGQLLRGVAIRPPQALEGMPYPILVTSTIHQNAIVRCIREDLKLLNEIILLA